ncbi:MAG: hypothetical protein AAGA15_08240 [Pseudomonadota bacterium]
MLRVLVIALAASAATAASAELNERQQAAFDRMLPALEVALTEQGGEALVPLAPMLATCIVTEAKRRELTSLGDGELDGEDTALLNTLMAKPEVQGCVAKAAGQG